MKESMMRRYVLSVLGLLGSVSILLNGCSGSPDSPALESTGTPNYTEVVTAGNFGTATYFVHPSGMVYVNGKMWIADAGNNSLQQWNPLGGSQIKSITTFNGGDTFNQPWGIGLDPVTGNLYVAGGPNGNVVIFDGNGNYLNKVTVGGTNVRGVAINPAGDKLYVTDYNGGGYIYSIGGTPTLPTLTFSAQFGTSAPGKLTHAYQCTVDPSGNVWVADYGGAKIEEYTSVGVYIKTITSVDFKKPTAVKVDSAGVIYVADENKPTKGRVLTLDPTGKTLGIFGRSDVVKPESVDVGGGFIWAPDWQNATVFYFG